MAGGFLIATDLLCFSVYLLTVLSHCADKPLHYDDVTSAAFRDQDWRKVCLAFLFN